MIYANCQSLFANYLEFKVLLEKYSPKLVFLSETRTTSEIENFEISINNYELVRCDSNSRKTGGCAIYIRKDIEFQIIKNEVQKLCWILVIKVTKGFQKGVYGVLYKSPQQKNKDFLKILDNWFEEIISDENFNIVSGDFNINLVKKGKYAKKIYELLDQHNLKQIVNKFTRETPTSRTIIDYVLTNSEKVNFEILNKEKISDHNTIAINNQNDRSRKINKKKTVKYLNYRKHILMNELEKVTWQSDKNMTLNEKVLFLESSLKKIIQKMIVEKKTYEEKNDWFDYECRNMKNQRNSLKKLYDETKTEENWKNYTITRNKYKNLLKSKQCNKIRSKIISNSKNSKKMWKLLKKLYKKPIEQIKMISFSDTLIKDEKKIAEEFNNFFVNSIEKIIKDIPRCDKNNVNKLNRTMNEFNFKKITSEKVIKIVKNIKIKKFHDNINGEIIFDAMDNCSFGQFFTEIINESLTNSKVPDNWKTATVEPIEKVSGSIKAEEYRPINKLPITEKILEIVVKEQLEEFLEVNDIYMEQQSGFRKLHSCESALNNIIIEWKKSLENQKVVVAVFLDFKRAFETVDRRLLLEKMENYGIRNKELEWFKNYFNNRKQNTKIGSAFSGKREVNCGVSQGSCLGPLLFDLYVNDLPNILKNSSVNMFADDTLLSVAADSVEEAIDKMEQDMKYLYDWLNYNKLSLNINKTKYMTFTVKKNKNMNHRNVQIGGEEIEKVKKIKYLGIIIDEKLLFVEHLNYVKAKLYSRLAIFRKLNHKLNAHTKIVLYKSLVSPYFDYCPTILFTLSESNIKQLQKIQNKFMRNILKVNKYARTKFMLEALKFQSVKERLSFNTLKFFYKIEKNLLPIYLQRHLNKNNLRHQYNLRGNNLYEMGKFTKSYTQNSIFYVGTALYNKFKTWTKETNFNHFEEFRRKAIEFVKTLN